MSNRQSVHVSHHLHAHISNRQYAPMVRVSLYLHTRVDIDCWICVYVNEVTRMDIDCWICVYVNAVTHAVPVQMTLF
jgi:hypothetical protein